MVWIQGEGGTKRFKRLSCPRRSTYVYMEEVEARTQKCRRPPISRLAFFWGAAGDRVAEWRPGARRGLSFEWAPVSASDRASFVPSSTQN